MKLRTISLLVSIISVILMVFCVLNWLCPYLFLPYWAIGSDFITALAPIVWIIQIPFFLLLSIFHFYFYKQVKN